MAETRLSPLQHNVNIVNPTDGLPEPWFIQWINQLMEEKLATDTTTEDNATSITDLETQIDNLVIDDLLDVDTTTVPPNDGDIFYFDSGSGLWLPGPAPSGGGGNWWDGNVPLAADFTYNQSGDAFNTSVTDNADLGMEVDFNQMVNSRFRFRGKDLPSAGAQDWEVTCRLLIEPVYSLITEIGLCLLESATGKFTDLGILQNGSNETRIRFSRGTNLTTYGATLVNSAQCGLVPLWFRITYTHATGSISPAVSMNGKKFTNYPTTNAAIFTTRGNKVGFICINGSTNANTVKCYCDYWVQSW